MQNAIVIPTYNERENIGGLIADIFRFVPKALVLVVDDNSQDGTAGEVEKIMLQHKNLHLLSRKKKDGLGNAYKAGIEVVLGYKSVETLITMDADFSHPPAGLVDLISKRNEYDFVIGSRYVKNAKILGVPIWRRVMSLAGNLLFRIFLNSSVKDLTGGFNAISTDILRQISIHTMKMTDYAFPVELKYRLIEEGASYKEIPIVFRARIYGYSKISFSAFLEALSGVWKIREFSQKYKK